MMDIPSPSQSGPATPLGRLLIVEDDNDLRTAMSIGLRMEGYSVQGAGSVEEAQDLLNQERVDLLITDWYLPDGTGAQVCAAGRKANPHLPIIALSGLHDGQAVDLAGC